MAIRFEAGGTGDVAVDWKQFNAKASTSGGSSDIVIGDAEW
jgi:hypothetical protein